MALCGANLIGCGCGLTVGTGLQVSGSGLAGDPWYVELDSPPALTSYTPTITAGVLSGSPVQPTFSLTQGKYINTNGWVQGWFRYEFATVGTGFYVLNRPVTNAGSGDQRFIGAVTVESASARLTGRVRADGLIDGAAGINPLTNTFVPVRITGIWAYEAL